MSMVELNNAFAGPDAPGCDGLVVVHKDGAHECTSAGCDVSSLRRHPMDNVRGCPAGQQELAVVCPRCADAIDVRDRPQIPPPDADHTPRRTVLSMQEALRQVEHTWSQLGADIELVRPGPAGEVVTREVSNALGAAPTPEARALFSWHDGLDVPGESWPVPMGRWNLIPLDESLRQHERFFSGLADGLLDQALVSMWRRSWLPFAVDHGLGMLFAIIDGPLTGQVHRVFWDDPPWQDELATYRSLPWVVSTLSELLVERFAWHWRTDYERLGYWRETNPSVTERDLGTERFGL